MGRPRIDDETREAVREVILANPDAVLDDKDLMRALVVANERAMGHNIVDLRGLAMQRLEARLDRLEDTHRAVIAAAYDNLAGTNMIHRAVLRLLDATRFEGFLKDLAGDVAQILKVDTIRLVLESPHAEEAPALGELGGVLLIVQPGGVDRYLAPRGGQARAVTLRQLRPEDGAVHGRRWEDVGSEACLRLDLGGGQRPALLVMGAEDPHHFSPQQGTDLLAFLGGVLERALRRWLAA